MDIVLLLVLIAQGTPSPGFLQQWLPVIIALAGGGLLGVLIKGRSEARNLDSSTAKTLQDMALAQAVAANERAARLEERVEHLKGEIDRLEVLLDQERRERARERRGYLANISNLEALLGGRREADPAAPALGVSRHDELENLERLEEEADDKGLVDISGPESDVTSD